MERSGASSIVARLTGDHALGIALLAGAVFLFWEASRLPLGTLRAPGPAMFPGALAVVLGFAAILTIIGGRHAARLAALSWPEARHAAQIMAVCAAGAFALERLGYRATSFAILFALLTVVERKPIASSCLVAAGVSLGSYALFASLLKVPLPIGVLGF